MNPTGDMKAVDMLRPECCDVYESQLTAIWHKLIWTRESMHIINSVSKFPLPQFVDPEELGLFWQVIVNNCGDVVHVIESALGNENGSADIVLVDDFLGGGTVGNATIMDEGLYAQRFAQFARAKIKIETLDRLWSPEGRIDVIKVDVEGNETQFLEGGKSTIALHRPALLIEVNLGQQALRNINFSEAIPSLLPERYFFAELRGRSMIEIRNLTDCTDADVLAMPQERRHEIV